MSVKGLVHQQKRGDLARLVRGTDAQVRAAYTEARQSVAQTLAHFAAAYRAELARVRSAADDDTATVPTIWLLTSGWSARLQREIGAAAHQAAQHSLMRVGDAQGDAAALGTRHAQALLTEAMQPAIDRFGAGLDWRPKP